MKIDLGEKGKTYHFEANVNLSGKKIGDIIKGEEIKEDLKGYELEIRGASDNAGFPYTKREGAEFKRILMKKGDAGFRIGRKKLEGKKGLRMKKGARGNTLSESAEQVNLLVKKAGGKALAEIFSKKEEAAEKPQEEKKE